MILLFKLLKFGEEIVLILFFLKNFFTGFFKQFDPVKHFLLCISEKFFHLNKIKNYFDKFVIVLHILIWILLKSADFLDGFVQLFEAHWMRKLL
jgi:hypothetical protein